ncbi:hypothetical protein CORT_0A08180 [Candida orthopsilosis Co 90-125]|uniref:Uncharacterized protein n=1 Tax=Candida orthopsilosis (strain 90-125) TaxID=1136231 RepID=H8WY88_CANO9|nr:hypothetical protein CORT_0A08180 [Candida orthopsilosis Co 90-125]CCG21203.1 hypothetical protein CORT_0A08180 [Candida orthopsilosis Co 90-125]
MGNTLLANSAYNKHCSRLRGSTQQKVPEYHPSLIVQDHKDDVTKVKNCGCSGPYCVKNVEWIPRAK